MNINLHIERLVLEGLPATGAEAAAIQAAVETELARRFREQGVPHMTGGIVPNLSGGQIQLANETTPHRTGNQIGQAVHSALAVPQGRGNPGGRRR